MKSVPKSFPFVRVHKLIVKYILLMEKYISLVSGKNVPWIQNYQWWSRTDKIMINQKGTMAAYIGSKAQWGPTNYVFSVELRAQHIITWSFYRLIKDIIIYDRKIIPRDWWLHKKFDMLLCSQYMLDANFKYNETCTGKQYAKNTCVGINSVNNNERWNWE